MRPQRGSREISTIGAKSTDAYRRPSMAAMRAPFSIRSGLNEAACPQRNRKNRLESMDHITAHNQRNAQARLLHCRTLVGIDGLASATLRIEPTSPFLISSAVVFTSSRRTDLIHLADLLFQRHLGKQGLHPLLHIVAFTEVELWHETNAAKSKQPVIILLFIYTNLFIHLVQYIPTISRSTERIALNRIVDVPYQIKKLTLLEGTLQLNVCSSAKPGCPTSASVSFCNTNP